MKTYTIIGGVNGVGKSSLTGVLRSELTDLGAVIDIDKLTVSLGGDKLARGKAAIRKIESCKETRRALTNQERQWVENTPHRTQTAAMLMLYAGL